MTSSAHLPCRLAATASLTQLATEPAMWQPPLRPWWCRARAAPPSGCACPAAPAARLGELWFWACSVLGRGMLQSGLLCVHVCADASISSDQPAAVFTPCLQSVPGWRQALPLCRSHAQRRQHLVWIEQRQRHRLRRQRWQCRLGSCGHHPTSHHSGQCRVCCRQCYGRERCRQQCEGGDGCWDGSGADIGTCW